ncbi:dynein regulatory complex protein 8 isoform X4 [Tamandua tetradactyla]|uniref:dynein regulatory complex protein 8 isoform X4 n=1 Tax=Tamandua tetradactyla TaxID=48850 RepID=UPI0040545CFC
MTKWPNRVGNAYEPPCAGRESPPVPWREQPPQRAVAAGTGQTGPGGLRSAGSGELRKEKLIIQGYLQDITLFSLSEIAVAEFHRKIREAFEVFDHESNNTVDVEEEEPTGYIRLEKFLPVMTEILLERRYRPIPEDILLRAFEVLDPAKRGFLTKEELIKYMTEEGEPFSQEEMEEMLSAAIDPESNVIHYKDYISMMVIDEN